MLLYLITPTSATEYHIAWLEISTPSGSLTIHKGHCPTIFPLIPYSHVIFKLKTGKQQTVTVQKGIAQVSRESVHVLATLAE